MFKAVDISICSYQSTIISYEKKVNWKYQKSKVNNQYLFPVEVKTIQIKITHTHNKYEFFERIHSIMMPLIK